MRPPEGKNQFYSARFHLIIGNREVMCDPLFPYGGNDFKWVRLGKQGCCFIGKQRPWCFINA